jgi:flagellar basal body-associated protein FliL
MNKKKKVLVIVIAFFAIIGILFAVLMGIYYYMSYTMQQEIRESMSRSDSPNPNLSPP